MKLTGIVPVVFINCKHAFDFRKVRLNVLSVSIWKPKN